MVETRAPWHKYQVQLRADPGNGLVDAPELVEADGVHMDVDGYVEFYLVEMKDNRRREHRIAWFNRSEVRWVRKERGDASG